MLTRREFLTRSSQLLLGLSIAPRLLRSNKGAPDLSITSVPESAWRELARQVSGGVLRPGSPNYLKTALPNNLRYARTLPDGIAMCANADDVANSILWAREHGVPHAARGGGHSYAGYSTTLGLMINTALMHDVTFDGSTMTVGPGARFKDLYASMQAEGVRITHGRCNTVGISGFLLGGGIGFNMRRLGLGCDQLLATELVTADGNILSCNEATNSDLFWACRGGAGGNFGINTSFTVQTFPIPSSVTAFNITWNSKIEQLYPALIDALANAPDTLGSRVELIAVTPEQFAKGEDVSVIVLGQLEGSSQTLAEILAPAFAVAAPASSSIEETDYWNAQINFLSEAGPPAFYQERSRFYGSLSDEMLAAAIDWARRWPGTSRATGITFFQTGAAVNQVPSDATAFVHRGSEWLMTIQLDWSLSDLPVLSENLEWQALTYEALMQFTTMGAYQNFPDPALNDYLDAYYGANLNRLELIKADIDPNSVFIYPQGIPPAF